MIQKETGGNLAENLDNLARLIRERFQFRRQVKIHTAHSRMTGTVLAVAPVLAAVILYLIAPEYMGPLFVEPAGRYMILVAAVLQIFGFLVIRRMTDLDY
jgi:tight adherence protein B